MFSNDPFQSQLSLGAYSGVINPYTASLQTGNPFAGVAQTSAISPFVQQQGYGGIANYAAIAQQQQLQQELQRLQQIQQLQTLASILASQGMNPQMFGGLQFNNPWQNNSFQNQPWQQQYGGPQNPLIAAALQNPILAQQLAQQQNPFVQQNPFTQSPYQLAPQSWVGQQIPGQFSPHHLQHLTGRGIY